MNSWYRHNEVNSQVIELAREYVALFLGRGGELKRKVGKKNTKLPQNAEYRHKVTSSDTVFS
jgi:hypothetical protein